VAVRAIVFDFDGVLADSEPLHLAAYQEVFAALGVTLTRDDYYANLLGYDDEGVFSVMSSRHGWRMDRERIAALVAEKSRVFKDIIPAHDVLYPGAASAVERLGSRYPLGIASGALKHEIEMVLRAAALDRHFRFIVAAGDTAESKPSPAPYLEAARLHGLPASECLAIEDSRWGILSAKGAGMKCVGISSTYPASELGQADTVIASLDQFTDDLIRKL
jgi:HAD superfamily hydrolase (TIGR01509 family)